MALELLVWGGWNDDGVERIKQGGRGRINNRLGEGRLLGSVSLLDKGFIIFIARKQKISRERGRRLDQSTEQSELVGIRAADLQVCAKKNH